MAFNLASLAGAGAADPALLDAFAPVAVRNLPPHAPRMLVVPRQQDNPSSIPTVNMFIDGTSSNMRYAASIVDVCADATTYALRCTSAAALPDETCGPNGVVITVTANPTLFRVSTTTVTRTLGRDVSATVQETCRLKGTTEAACAATLGGTVGKESTTTSSTTTYLGTRVRYYDVAITGGAEKTANPTACAVPFGSGAGEGVRAGVLGVVAAVGLGLVMVI